VRVGSDTSGPSDEGQNKMSRDINLKRERKPKPKYF